MDTNAMLLETIIMLSYAAALGGIYCSTLWALKFIFRSKHTFVVCCVLLSTLALTVGGLTIYAPILVRMVKAWLFNTGHACAVDRAKRQSLLTLYSTPLVGPVAVWLGPMFGLYSWGEANLDFGPLCTYLDSQGFVPVVTAPSVVVWFKTLCYIAVCSVIPVVCLWAYLSFCVCQVIRRAFTGLAVSVDAPVLPFTLEAATDAISTLNRLLSVELKSVPAEVGHHKKLAFVRARTEMTVLSFLRRYTSKTRDIGGSLKRNSKLGADHHVCYPNLDAADHRRVALRDDFAVDAAIHTGQDCPCSNRLSIMSYVDFHLSREDLVGAIRSPTLVVTHDFYHNMGTSSWYDGEASVTVTPAGVFMETSGGSSYSHGYHQWESEGLIVASGRAVQYRRLGFSDKYTMVLLVWPCSGTYYLNDPLNLRSSGGLVEKVDCSDGVIAVRSTGDKGKLTYVFQKGAVKIGHLSFSTIIRAAHAVSSLKRGDRYKATVDSVVRSRIVADEEDLTLLMYATNLVLMLSDEIAVSLSRDTYIHGDPSTLSWVQRRLIRFLVRSSNRAWILGPLCSRISRFVVGPSARFSLVPWAWSEQVVPMYETVPPTETVELTDTPGASRPFLSGGQGDVAGPASPDSDVPRQDAQQRDVVSAVACDKHCPTATSTPPKLPQRVSKEVRDPGSDVPHTSACHRRHRKGAPCFPASGSNPTEKIVKTSPKANKPQPPPKKAGSRATKPGRPSPIVSSTPAQSTPTSSRGKKKSRGSRNPVVHPPINPDPKTSVLGPPPRMVQGLAPPPPNATSISIARRRGRGARQNGPSRKPTQSPIKTAIKRNAEKVYAAVVQSVDPKRKQGPVITSGLNPMAEPFSPASKEGAGGSDGKPEAPGVAS